MIYLQLILSFFNIGLFSFGGGYATLPFLYQISEQYHWYSIDDLSNMIAVSSITPGPIGINMATFAGFKTAGILGALISTCAIVLPSLIFVIIISKILKNFRENNFIKSIIYVLKPLGCGLLSAVGINMFIQNFLNDTPNIAFAPKCFLLSVPSSLIIK